MLKLVKVDFSADGKQWGSILSGPEREFVSKSKGFNVTGKIVDPDTGKSYQISCNIVEIGSKPKPGKK
jgi:uncharacterized protein (DUF2147 family)